MINYTAANIKLWSKLGARAVFGSIAAPELIARNENIIFVVADVAASAGLGRLNESFPENLINVGIAEQNMIGIAAGLASEGYLPYAASFAPFVTARVADQIRMNMAYMGLPIKLVALASGLAMGINGPSHLGFEDAAIIHAMPGIAIVTPADPVATIKAALAASLWPGPLYLRLTGIPGMSIVYENDFNFEIGKANILKEGRETVFIASGSMVYACLKAAELLENDGIDAGVIDMHTLRPLDVGTLDSVSDSPLFVTVEEHSIAGSLGYALAEYLVNKPRHPALLRLGLTGYPHAGSYEELLQSCGLTPEAIAREAKKKLASIGQCSN